MAEPMYFLTSLLTVLMRFYRALIRVSRRSSGIRVSGDFLRMLETLTKKF
jgi:hypothetical protein